MKGLRSGTRLVGWRAIVREPMDAKFQRWVTVSQSAVQRSPVEALRVVSSPVTPPRKLFVVPVVEG